MRKYSRSFILALLVLWLVLPVSAALAEEVKIGVKGMVCAFCAQSLKKKFSAEPAVSEVVVNLETKLIDLKLKSGQTLSDESIKKIVLDAGYNVDRIERLP